MILGGKCVVTCAIGLFHCHLLLTNPNPNFFSSAPGKTFHSILRSDLRNIHED